ncbi:MAG: hypothetical protein LDL41_18710, partial [Coleofasciculus sp. S288]|nr:hypothetical protein [Coleofasciculus sp. S288]
MKTAQATPPEQQMMLLEQNPVVQGTDLENVTASEPLDAAKLSGKESSLVAIADQQPTLGSEAVSERVSIINSAVQAVGELTHTNVVQEGASVPQQSNEINSTPSLRSQISSSKVGSSSSVAVSVDRESSATPDKPSTLYLSQIPTLLPVPPSPAPLGSGNSTSGQLPISPPTLP